MPTADGWSSRGDLAYALFNALGLTQVSGESRFSDGGMLGGVATTLADLGITKGVGDGKFGTGQATTRGQAFTMIARALKLADASTDIATASQALVDAGIVKGYGNTGELGLNDPLAPEHLALLIGRIEPELEKTDETGETIREKAASGVIAAQDTNRANTDPKFAAYLNQIGVGIGEVQDEIALRKELFNFDSKRRSETFARSAESSVDGVQTDFENRGFTRSGTRVGQEALTRQNVGYEAKAASLAAQRAFEENQRALGRRQTELEIERAEARTDADTRRAEQDTLDSY